jgi:hypothetical protein
MNPLLLRALLAALPVLGVTLKMRDGFLYGTVGAGIFLLAALIFLAIKFALPAAVHRLSLFLLLLVLGVIGMKVFSLSGIFLASLLLLPLPELFRRRGRLERVGGKVLLAGFCFWALLTAHGALSHLLGLKLGLGLFQMPAGSYLLAGFLPLFLRKP